MKRGLPAGWYIILYHDVSWEESRFLRHVGGTCPPDVFRDHVRFCSEFGELVGVNDGLARLQSGDVRWPLFSFWFDDGFAGVRRHAAPILAERGVTAATSVCSRFVARAEMFWRLKLSYLVSVDAGRRLRSRLKRFGFGYGQLVRRFTLERFSHELLAVIDELYDEAVSPEMQADAFRVFDTAEGLRELDAAGWVIANHSAAHYPIGEKHANHLLMQQFSECEEAIQAIVGHPSEFWVFPFSGTIEREAIDAIRAVDETVSAVLVADRVNRCSDYQADPRLLFRINAPATNRHQLGDALVEAALRTGLR